MHVIQGLQLFVSPPRDGSTEFFRPPIRPTHMSQLGSTNFFYSCKSIVKLKTTNTAIAPLRTPAYRESPGAPSGWSGPISTPPVSLTVYRISCLHIFPLPTSFLALRFLASLDHPSRLSGLYFSFQRVQTISVYSFSFSRPCYS